MFYVFPISLSFRKKMLLLSRIVVNKLETCGIFARVILQKSSTFTTKIKKPKVFTLRSSFFVKLCMVPVQYWSTRVREMAIVGKFRTKKNSSSLCAWHFELYGIEINSNKLGNIFLLFIHFLPLNCSLGAAGSHSTWQRKCLLNSRVYIVRRRHIHFQFIFSVCHQSHRDKLCFFLLSHTRNVGAV